MKTPPVNNRCPVCEYHQKRVEFYKSKIVAFFWLGVIFGIMFSSVLVSVR